jgi:nicotinamide-nucleotide amidase
MDAEAGADVVAARLGLLLSQRRWTIAVAESLTGGLLVQALARAEGSGDWLLGGVVAYATSVKHELLDVSAASVVSELAAAQMASAVRRRLGSDIALAVTGVAGPEPQDGEPPGTVWIGVDSGAAATATLFRTSGTPSEICDRTVIEALRKAILVVGETA